MIELKNVSFTYNAGNGIKNINLSIKKGEVILLTGTSGCGKTTLTRLINGLIPNYYEGDLSGEILLYGKNISKLPVYETSTKVGSVFQNPRSQFFNVDTTSELAFAPENQGISEEVIKERIESTVDEFKIYPLMNRSIFKLSGGEKQKIACASVSVADSNIIVLDEPSSNLDAEAIEELKRIITLWKTQGKTIVIAEHRLYFLRELIDKMIVMKDGKIIKEYTSKEIKSMKIEETQALGLRPLELENIKFEEFNTNLSEEKVKIEDLKFSYRNSTRGINIKNVETMKDGIVAIIGHNGAGKSTFARCLCGLEKKCKGKVRIGEESYGNKERLKNCYMVMQDVNHQLFTESVLDEVLLSLEEISEETDEKKEKEAEDILESLDLLQFKDVHPMALSGGQKQRVAIASAVASKRQIILFDEPTSGLDLLHMKQVATHLKKLKDMGKTIFVICHDPEFILNCCTEVLHLENGLLKEQYAINEKNIKLLKEFFINI